MQRKTAEKVQNFAGAAQAREKASWRRRKVQFRGATGLPRRRFCGAKPRHTNSAPQERSRLAGFREDPDLPQGMIAWYCGASREKSKLAPPESSIPGWHRLASAPLLRRQTQAYQFCAAREKQIGRIQRNFWETSGLYQGMIS